MDKNINELNVIKEMLASGTISKSDYDKMHAQILSKGTMKNGPSAKTTNSTNTIVILTCVVLAILACGGYWWWANKKAADLALAKEYAEQYCACEKMRNDAYLEQISRFVASLDEQPFRVLNEMDKAVAKLKAVYDEDKFGIEVASCLNNTRAQKSKYEGEYGSYEYSSSPFWTEFKVIVSASIELTQQTQQIKTMWDIIENKRSTFKYATAEQLEDRKSTISVFLNEMYQQMPYDYFDAYSYFGYAVEKYFNLTNITPTDIKYRLMGETDHVNFSHKLIDETLKLKGIVDGREEWLYSTEYYAWRPSLEKHLITNVWYTIILNAENKIVSYSETVVENSKFYTSEEYEALKGNSEPDLRW